MEIFVNASTTLNGAITSGATSLVLTSASQFPTSGTFRIKIGSEILKVTSIAGVTCTVVRGTENTVAASHANLDPVVATLTGAGISAIATLCWDDSVPGANSNIKTQRALGGVVDNTKTGALNLGSRSTGASVGASANYASVLGGDKCFASADYAVAAGEGAEASGIASVSIGSTTQAKGDYSFAAGSTSVALGTGSFAAGVASEANGVGSFAQGLGSKASGPGSVALGGSAASGDRAVSFGYNSEARGEASLCTGKIGVAHNLCSSVFGLQTEAYGSHSIAMGEDTRTGDSDIVTMTHGQAAFCGNHFSRVNGRASTSFGCNVYVAHTSERALAHGFATSSTRITQCAHAAGGFSYESNHESLEYAVPAHTGHAQTNVMVFRGESAGTAANEELNLGSAYGLAFGPAPEYTLKVENGKTYSIRCTVSMAGYIGGVLRSRMMTYDVVAKGVAGSAVIVDQGAPFADRGDAAAASWNITAGGIYDGVAFFLKTGTTTSKARAACRVEFTEVIWPVAP